MKRHLIGIGGVGMSALATALKRQGDEVTGADRTLGTPNIRFLESLGIKVYPDDGSGVELDTDEVIVSTAIEETNSGLLRARTLGIPVVHRAKALAAALAKFKLVAVVGTCGKSTVTAMLGHILGECGFDPMCVNGANVPGWKGAVRYGKGDFAVAEVDESDKSLVAFRPYAAIITNASADHYSKEEMDEVFDSFIKDLPGPLVDGRHELEPLECLDSLEVPVPGAHNRQNAELAVRMAVKLGADPDDAVKAMRTFRGVERRLQCHSAQSVNRLIGQSVNSHSVNRLIGQSVNSPLVYDDYAHNPEKLHAMWTTLAEAHPGGLCVVWRPHGYAPLRKMLDALAEMFRSTIGANDHLLLLPVYDAGGTTDRSINSDALAALLPADKVTLVADHHRALEWIKANARFAVYATAGARDVALPELADKIAEFLEDRK